MDKKNGQLLCGSEVENLEGSSKVSMNWEDFVKELKMQWKMMWRDRIDDKVRAEGVAREDYSLLFLKQGTIIIATRKYRPPDFVEILDHYRGVYDVERGVDYVNPVVGGYTKFIRDFLKRQPRFGRSKIREPPMFEGKESRQQRKKGGRGWVHRF